MSTDHSAFADHHTARSLAVQYEVRLKEDLAKFPANNGPSAERMHSCFQLLDELLPKLGVYMPVVKSIRNELFDAVYSDEYTSTVLVRKPAGTKDSATNEPTLLRIPYFVLVYRLFDQRNEKAEALQDQLLKFTDRMRKREDVINEMEREVAEAKQNTAQVEEDNGGLKVNLFERGVQIEELEKELKSQDEVMMNLRAELNQNKLEHRSAVTAAEGEINALHHFRANFETANDAFAEPLPVAKRFNTAFATKQNQLQNNLMHAKRLQRQLLDMQNMVIEEYDEYIEKHKEDLSKFVFDQTDQDAPLTKELMAAQDRFKRGTTETADELTLLALQISAIEKELKSLRDEQEKKKQQHTALGLDSRGTTPAGGTGQNREEAAESLVPEECLISKYGAMMYTSANQGKTFTPIKDSRFCTSCGEKTVICPHRCLHKEHIIQLPINCSHIMITRPGVRLLEARPEPIDLPVEHGRTVGGFVVSSQSRSPDYESIVQRLWEDYEKRVKASRPIPRRLSMGRCLSIIEQFYTRVIWQDEYDVDEEAPVSLLDMLYRYFTERYVLPGIAHLGAFDFLQAVVTYSNESRMVWLFGEQLAGTVDPACFRYVLLLCELLDSFSWKSVAEYEEFSTIVYPFCTEDDVEQLAMGYASFSENRPAKQIVFEYNLHMLIKRHEPWVSEWESRLKLHPCRVAGWMSEIEFAECMEVQCPQASERLRRRLFCETEVHMPGERDIVPCSRLAYIASYLNLLYCAPTMAEELARVAKAKGHDEPSPAFSPPADAAADQPSPQHVATMSSIKPSGTTDQQR